MDGWMDTALEKSLYVVRKWEIVYWNISKDTEYRAQKRKKKTKKTKRVCKILSSLNDNI